MDDLPFPDAPRSRPRGLESVGPRGIVRRPSTRREASFSSGQVTRHSGPEARSWYRRSCFRGSASGRNRLVRLHRFRRLGESNPCHVEGESRKQAAINCDLLLARGSSISGDHPGPGRLPAPSSHLAQSRVRLCGLFRSRWLRFRASPSGYPPARRREITSRSAPLSSSPRGARRGRRRPRRSPGARRR